MDKSKDHFKEMVRLLRYNRKFHSDSYLYILCQITSVGALVLGVIVMIDGEKNIGGIMLLGSLLFTVMSWIYNRKAGKKERELNLYEDKLLGEEDGSS